MSMKNPEVIERENFNVNQLLDDEWDAKSAANKPNFYQVRITTTGVAGCGKDLFYIVVKRVLKNSGYEAERFALADVLKEEIRQQLIDEKGIDILNCSREEKDLVRPILIDYGMQKRRETNGRYFIDRLLPKILNSNADAIVIVDARYDEYEKDELYFTKFEIGSTLVHITLMENGKKLEAKNDHEKHFDPIMFNAADIYLVWKHRNDFEDEETYNDYLDDKVKNVLNEVGYNL